MKLQVWWALARGVLLESLRRKDLWVIAILGMLIMASSGALGFFGVDGLQTFAKDLAVTVLGMFSTIIAILTTARLLPDEIRNRTLYPLLARPISRFDLLAGKLLGAMLATWLAFVILLALTAVALLMFGVKFEGIMLQYALLKMMGLGVLCAVTLTLSAFMTPSAAATLSFVVAFGSSMIIRGLTMAYETASPGMQWFFKVLNAMLPQFGLFDIGPRVANEHWSPVPMWVVGALLAYGLAYGGAMLMLAWSKFRSQAV